MLKIMPVITFHQEMPHDLFQSKHFDPNVSSLIVFDDLMRTVMNDDKATNMFTEGAHYRNISVVLSYKINFCKGKRSRTLSANAHHFISLKNLELF